ncbi:hypothetical protein IJG14_08330 [bacterium]|nr:hypothetical protein [bacterium]
MGTRVDGGFSITNQYDVKAGKRVVQEDGSVSVSGPLSNDNDAYGNKQYQQYKEATIQAAQNEISMVVNNAVHGVKNGEDAPRAANQAFQGASNVAINAYVTAKSQGKSDEEAAKAAKDAVIKHYGLKVDTTQDTTPERAIGAVVSYVYAIIKYRI